MMDNIKSDRGFIHETGVACYAWDVEKWENFTGIEDVHIEFSIRDHSDSIYVSEAESLERLRDALDACLEAFKEAKESLSAEESKEEPSVQE